MAYYKYSQILSRNNCLQLSHLCLLEDMEPGENVGDAGIPPFNIAEYMVEDT